MKLSVPSRLSRLPRKGSSEIKSFCVPFGTQIHTTEPSYFAATNFQPLSSPPYFLQMDSMISS